jgi:pyridoxamine 5'-phosphate oxidase family protein
MNSFTPEEIEYLGSQRLGHIATSDAEGDLYVVPVGFLYNAELGTIDIAGRDMARSKKFRNVAGNGRVAFVVDDVLPPWRPRGVRIRGRGEAIIDRSNPFPSHWGAMVGEIIRITPVHVTSWGIETSSREESKHTVERADGRD